MKKLLVVGVFLVLCTVPLGLFAAQNEAVDKGSIVLDLGSSLGVTFYTGDTEETDLTFGTDVDLFGFSPSLNLSYFIIDNLSLGGTVIFASLKPSGADATTMFKIGPEVNYYIPLKDKLLVDVKGFAAFNSLKSSGAADATTQLSFGGGASVVYLLKEYLGLYGGADLTLGLDARSGGSNVGGSYFGIGLGAGLKVFL